MFMASRVILSNFFEEQWTQNHPQYLSGLSRALFPTTFLEIAVYQQGYDNSKKNNNNKSVGNTSKLAMAGQDNAHNKEEFQEPTKIICF